VFFFRISYDVQYSLNVLVIQMQDVVTTEYRMRSMLESRRKIAKGAMPHDIVFA